jgi:hypothetical protein
MTALLDTFTAMWLMLLAAAVYNLQSWLERWDRQRHADD